MPTLNEIKYETLNGALGGPGGTLNELERRWLIQETGGTGTLNELWHLYFDGVFVPPGPLNQRAARFLTEQGLTGTLNEMWYQYWGLIGVPYSNLIVNSRMADMSGSVAGLDFVEPSGWTPGFWTPDNAITYTADPQNQGCNFICTSNRGFLTQDLDLSAFIGEEISLSVFVDAASLTSTQRAVHITSGATELARVPKYSPGFVGRLYGRYQVTAGTVTLRFGAGTTVAESCNISLSRPMITVGSVQREYIPTDPPDIPTP